jgi:hypothetical protein
MKLMIIFINLSVVVRLCRLGNFLAYIHLGY